MKSSNALRIGLASLLLGSITAGTGASIASAGQIDSVAFALEAPSGPTTLAIANANTGRVLFQQTMPQSQNGQANIVSLVASQATKLVYATLESVNYPFVISIDPRTGAAATFFTLPNGDGAEELALSADGLTLYVVGAANSYRVDASTGALERTGPSIGGFPQTGYHLLAASPTTLFTPFGSGYTANSAKSFRYEYQVGNGVTPLAFALSPDASLLYTAQYDDNAYIIDIAKKRALAMIPLGTIPNDLVADASTDRLYVSTGSGVTVISTKSATIVATVAGIGAAENLAVDPATHACLAATSSGLWRIDAKTLRTKQLYAANSVTLQGVTQTY
jgi:hypothetical protein